MQAKPLTASGQAGAVLSYPGVMQHAQQIARALYETGDLRAYVTSYAFRENGLISRALQGMPGNLAAGALRQLQRRAVTEIPESFLKTYPWGELMRTLAAKAKLDPIAVDKLWDRMARKFDERVAREHVPGASSIHAFEYTALSSFGRAAELGVQRILHLPSLDSRKFEEISQREREEWPQLASEHDDYFAAMFEQRYARRQAEIALADLMVANSSLTRRSHIAAGANPDRIVVVPLAAPEAIAQPFEPDMRRPLEIVWAGTFQLRKGAHYFLKAWRELDAGEHAYAKVFGAVDVPEGVLVNLPAGIDFQGSVPAKRLFEEFERADVLVFPTLSDGFGMVVTEAFARGLPVICSDQAGAADFVQPGRNGLLVPAADVSALTTALQWCLDHRIALREMRMEALQTAKSYQWADYRARLSQALQEHHVR